VPLFLTSALDGGEWSASHPCHFTTGERAPGTHWIGGWVGPKPALDDMEERKILPLPGIEPQPSSSDGKVTFLYMKQTLSNTA
jgi:hypothetical protein